MAKKTGKSDTKKKKVTKQKTASKKKTATKKTTKKVVKSFKDKFIRDPIHGLIRIDSQEALDIINSKAFQRLRNIKQLGFTYYVYPGAEHTRFTHSLGVYHLSKRMYKELNKKNKFNKKDAKLIEITALLHDIGHGPFSHQFERVLEKELNYKYFKEHEEWSFEILKNDPTISHILNSIDNNLIDQIEFLLKCMRDNDIKKDKRFKKIEHLISIVSSQFDVDRFDYMFRDSYMTGVRYGKFDLDWIFRNISLQRVPKLDPDNQYERNDKNTYLKIVIDAKRGLSSLENYLIGLLQLYQNVYLHKTVLATNMLFTKIFKRAIEVIIKKSDKNYNWPIQLQKIAENKKLKLDEYIELTDSFFLYFINDWSKNSKDKILKDLSTRLITRKLFKFQKILNIHSLTDNIIKIKSELKRKKLPHEYYFSEDHVNRDAYTDYYITSLKKKIGQEIWIKSSNNDRPMPFTEFAKDNLLSNAILKLNLDKHFIIYPHEISDFIEKLKI